MKKRVVKRLVDVDTGELIKIEEGDKLQIISEKRSKAIQKSYNSKLLDEEIKEWNEELGGFIFVLFEYCDDILDKHPEITPEDITKLFYLATYVNYDGYLIYDGLNMTKKIMFNLLGLSRNIFDDFYNKMIKVGIFIIEKSNVKINNTYFVKGELDKNIQKHYDYTRIYINTIRYLFENVSIRKHRQLGIYFKLIPYIHRQQNVLCWNPDSIAADIHFMTARELQDKLGYHRNGVRGFIKELLSIRLNNNEAILGFFRTEYDEGKSYVIINPRVFYGGNFDLKEGRYGVVKWFKGSKK